MDISNMIDAIQRMPNLFLGSNKITALWHFLNGYEAAERANDICQREKLFPLPFQYMHEYTAYRLQDLSTAGWCYQILNSCDGVEDSFFASLEKAQKGTESYFGPIDSWIEFTAPDISFGKNIVI